MSWWAHGSPAGGGTVGSHLLKIWVLRSFREYTPLKSFCSLTEHRRHCIGWGWLSGFNYWPHFFTLNHIYALATTSMSFDFYDLLWLMKYRQKFQIPSLGLERARWLYAGSLTPLPPTGEARAGTASPWYPEEDEKSVTRSSSANSGERNKSLSLYAAEILWLFTREHYCGNG